MEKGWGRRGFRRAEARGRGGVPGAILSAQAGGENGGKPGEELAAHAPGRSM